MLILQSFKKVTAEDPLGGAKITINGNVEAYIISPIEFIINSSFLNYTGPKCTKISHCFDLNPNSQEVTFITRRQQGISANIQWKNLILVWKWVGSLFDCLHFLNWPQYIEKSEFQQSYLTKLYCLLPAWFCPQLGLWKRRKNC